MDKSGLLQYPTPKASIAAFILSLILVVFIGSVLQYYTFLPGLYITEWLLILGPPVVLLWRKKVSITESLKLQKFTGYNVLLGILGGLGIYFLLLGAFYVMISIIGPYPTVESLEKAFPTTWLGLIPWILAIGFSAGFCEEALFRGFIQSGLQTRWRPLTAVIITAVLFGVFHLDPWRIPSATLLGLLAGYLVIRTGSLYTAIILHTTSNTLGQILEFANKLPNTQVQWAAALILSVGLTCITLFIVERKKK